MIAGAPGVVAREVEMPGDHAGAVARSEVEQREPAGGRESIEQARRAIVTVRGAEVRAGGRIEPVEQRDVGSAQRADERQPVRHQRPAARHAAPHQVRAQRHGAQVHGILGLDVEHAGQHAAVLRGKAAAREERALQHVGIESREQAPRCPFVVIGMADLAAVDADQGLPRVAAAHVQRGAFVGRVDARQGAQRLEHVGGASGRGDDIDAAQRGAFALPDLAERGRRDHHLGDRNRRLVERDAQRRGFRAGGDLAP